MKQWISSYNYWTSDLDTSSFTIYDDCIGLLNVDTGKAIDIRYFNNSDGIGNKNYAVKYRVIGTL